VTLDIQRNKRNHIKAEKLCLTLSALLFSVLSVTANSGSLSGNVVNDRAASRCVIHVCSWLLQTVLSFYTSLTTGLHQVTRYRILKEQQ